MVRPRVQFVSKPIVSPFQDGTKCLVRDLVTHYENVDARVMGTAEGAPELFEHASVEAVYSSDGAYQPALRQNLRAALWLLLKSRVDLWHFVFAPNPRSSQVGRYLKALRRLPVVQTIASPPRSFESPRALLFGDQIVAQSEWTRDQFLAQAPELSDRITVIPPPAPLLAPPSDAARAEVEARLSLAPSAPLFVYPGDLEVSQGAARFLDLAILAHRVFPEATFVFAYRDKTPRAQEHARELQARADAALPENHKVRFAKNVLSIHALVSRATAIVFPVDDLYGKVDLPIVLLEAMVLGVPVVALDHGTLKSLRGALLLPYEPEAWVEWLRRLHSDPRLRAERCEEGQKAASTTFSPLHVARAYEGIYRKLLRIP